MTSGLGDINVILGADTAPFAAGMAKARGELAATERAGGSMGSALATGAKVVAGLGVAGAAAGVGFAVMAGNFQQATTQIVTGAGESAANLDLIRKGLLAMAGEVGSTPDQLAKGLYNIESAGFHGAKALDILRASAEGAKVGQADQAVVADALTSALNAYGMSGDKATNVTNDLIATVAAGKMHMADLAGSIGSVLAPANAVGVSLPEVSAAIATMTMQGTDAAQATTYLRQMLLALDAQKPSTVKALAEIGLAGHDVAEGLKKQPDGFIATLRTISEHLSVKFPEDSAKAVEEFKKVKAGTETADQALANLANNTSPEYVDALKQIAGGSKQMMGMLELTGSHLGTLQANYDSISAAANKSGKEVNGWALVQEDFNTKLDKAKGAAAALAIQIGTPLLGPLGAAMGVFSDTISILEGNASSTQKADDAASHIATTLQGIGHWITTDFWPALVGIGTNLWNYVINPLVHVASVVIPALITALGFVVQHFGDILKVVGPLAVALAALWAVDKVVGWGKTVATTLETAMAKIKATSGSSLFPNLFGGGAKPAGAGFGGAALSSEMVQHVFVVNWPAGMMGGGGFGGLGGKAMTAEEQAAQAELARAYPGTFGGGVPAVAGKTGMMARMGGMGMGAIGGVTGAFMGQGFGSDIGGMVGGQTGSEVGGALGGVAGGAGMGMMMGGPVGAAIGASVGALTSIIGNILSTGAQRKEAAAGTNLIGNLQDISKGGGGFAGLGGSIDAKNDTQGLQAALARMGISTGGGTKSHPFAGGFFGGGGQGDPISPLIQSMVAALKAGTLKTNADVTAYATTWDQISKAGMGQNAAQQQATDATKALQKIIANGVAMTDPEVKQYGIDWATIVKHGGDAKTAAGDLAALAKAGVITNGAQTHDFLGTWDTIKSITHGIYPSLSVMNDAMASGAIKSPADLNNFNLTWASIVATTGNTNTSASDVLAAMQSGQTATSIIATAMQQTANQTPAKLKQLDDALNKTIGQMTLTAQFSQDLASSMSGAAAQANRDALALAGQHVGYSLSQGGHVMAPESGAPATLHGEEVVLSKKNTDPALWQWAVGSVSGGTPLTPLSGGGMTGSFVPLQAQAAASGGPRVVQIHHETNVHGLTADDVLPAIQQENEGFAEEVVQHLDRQ